MTHVGIPRALRKSRNYYTDGLPRFNVVEGGRGVLEGRALHPERSLAEHYDPLAMDPALLKAHAALDRAVDKAFGATTTLRTEEQRLALLFTRYTEMTQAEQA